jgi:hypothetical protein
MLKTFFLIQVSKATVKEPRINPPVEFKSYLQQFLVCDKVILSYDIMMN